MMWSPGEILLCDWSGVLGEGLVRLFPHLLKLVVSHPLKQSSHASLATVELHPLCVCACVCVSGVGVVVGVCVRSGG